MLNVAYFSNQFATAQGHGITRYAHEMYKGLHKFDDLAIRPVAAWSSLSSERLSALQAETGLELVKLGRRVTPLAWHYLDVPTLERLIGGTVDVVHAVSLGYAIATRKPYVVTVHDLGPLTHPEYFTNTKPWIMERSLRQAEARADAIVCVSQSTADEVEGYLGAHVADRIRVIKEGVSPEFFAPSDMTCLAGLDLPADDVPVILTAGKISPRKNVQGVLNALKLILDKIDHHLVLVGGAGWETEAVLKELDDSALQSRVHLLDYVTNEQLRALYRRASLYIHPSLYEGFGLTVLEAMASGVPVITSNTSSLPEVAGGAGLLVDPTDVADIAQAICAICTDAPLRDAKIAEGLARAKLFSWDECSRELRDVFADVGR
ncbi:D-inositol 3-phosphate glycosyltransferase [Roseovarius albus]|uniref:D-inositol 3-phosphate glycosyltransferase n=1 Tax=Roseovarius albus TaxID=1247867 RepID=A0A1X6ZTN1_9RHOB|nr:glycosyltransferase family 1 protein [Roseovarius albus]SLN59263.1 D-inositol 3-phosphate glycosyltransferase [Roseovarius albus]